MKTAVFIGTLALVFWACETNPDDAKEAAHEENQEKFDSDMKTDYKFAETAADDGIFEVEVAQLARTNAFSQEVKDFAEQMHNDHSAANKELDSLAGSKNISIPAAMSEEKQIKYGALAKKMGKDFDETYAEMMVKAHQNAIDLFENEVKKGHDADLRDWAAAKLPTLRHHLEMAEKIKSNTD